jgi:hypothetical protein
VESGLGLNFDNILHESVNWLWWVSGHTALHIILLLLLLNLEIVKAAPVVQWVTFHTLLLLGVGSRRVLRLFFVLNFGLIYISWVWIWLVLVLKQSLPLKEILSLWILTKRLGLLLLSLIRGRVQVLLN